VDEFSAHDVISTACELAFQRLRRPLACSETKRAVLHFHFHCQDKPCRANLVLQFDQPAATLNPHQPQRPRLDTARPLAAHSSHLQLPESPSTCPAVARVGRVCDDSLRQLLRRALRAWSSQTPSSTTPAQAHGADHSPNGSRRKAKAR
jgi:hypothetical protein